MSSVHHYGLHRDGDLVFLHEQGEGRCLNKGLSSLESPFSLTPPRQTCPHALPPPAEGDVPDHPLVAAIGPIQTGQNFQVPASGARVVNAMTRMVNPLRPITYAFWAVKSRDIAYELNVTNAAPLVIMGFEPKHFVYLQRLIAMPKTRNIILVGDLRMSGAEQLDADLDPELDWRSVGQALLGAYI